MSLLINRLVNREISYSENVLVRKSADHAHLMRKALLDEMPVPSAESLAGIYEENGIPYRLEFVMLIGSCSQAIKSIFIDNGISLAEVR